MEPHLITSPHLVDMNGGDSGAGGRGGEGAGTGEGKGAEGKGEGTGEGKGEGRGEGKGADGEGAEGGDGGSERRASNRDPVRQISIGHSHFGALTRSGKVYMWGGGEAYGGKVFDNINNNLRLFIRINKLFTTY